MSRGPAAGGGAADARMVREVFDPTSAGVRAARKWVCEVVDQVDGTSDPVRDELQLIVSELAANAVLHAATPFEAAAGRIGHRWRIEVADDSPVLPVIKDNGRLAPSGRGLKIVDQLASRWGVEQRDGAGGKVVWAELDIGPDGEVSSPPPASVVGEPAGPAFDLSQRLRLALEAGDLGTWQWDATTGDVIWDERLERIFGLEPGTFDGTYEMYERLLHEDDRGKVAEAVEQAMVDGSTYRIDHRIVWPDGSVHWIQGRGAVTFDESGEITGTVGCASDITGLKLAQIEAEQRATEARELAGRERRRRERFEFLASLTDASIQAETHGEYMERVTAAAVPRLGDWCVLHFVCDPGDVVERRIAHSDPARARWAAENSGQYAFDPATITDVPRVLRTGGIEYLPEVTPTAITEVVDDLADGIDDIERARTREVLEALSLSSVIALPLVTKRGVIGAVQFISAESGRHYDDDDLALARAAAGRLADALENIWLMDVHRGASATFQRSLLPPRVPEIPGLEIAVRYWPAGVLNQAGGDFYDVFPRSRHSWAVVIGDVCGKGPDAAAVTSIARHTFRACAKHGHDHRTVLEWVNDAILHSDRSLFCTACYATIEIDREGDLQVVSASAGHPLPIVVRADGSVSTLGRPGTLLGVFEDITARPAEVRLEAGDAVVLYTDGVSDLPPPLGFTPEEVAELVGGVARGRHAEGMADALHAALEERLPLSRRHDDIALVVLRRVR